MFVISKERCLNCATGDYARPLSEWGLRQNYQEYCQNWQERGEIQVQTAIKQHYKKY